VYFKRGWKKGKTKKRKPVKKKKKRVGGSRSQVLSSPWTDLVVGVQSSLYLGGWWVTFSTAPPIPFISLHLYTYTLCIFKLEFVIVIVVASASLTSI
jgi:hypothetical protein